jgi:glutamate carboxypeptidase
VLEPALGPTGALKTSRKGVGEYLLQTRGRAAHAGLDPRKGASAITELAHQLVTIQSLTDYSRGITLNPGIIRGGGRSNVIAAEAEAVIDVRIREIADAVRVDRRLRALRPRDRRTHLLISGGINRPPFQRTPAGAELFTLARNLAKPLGIALKQADAGGGSDGNFTAALGVPTLDGLGAVGDGAHAPNEHVVIAELPRRAALLVHLICSLASR